MSALINWPSLMAIIEVNGNGSRACATAILLRYCASLHRGGLCLELTHVQGAWIILPLVGCVLDQSLRHVAGRRNRFH